MKEKPITSGYTPSETPRIGESVETGSRFLVAGGLGEVTTNGYRISLRGDRNVLELIVLMVAQPCEYIKTTELHPMGGEFRVRTP